VVVGGGYIAVEMSHFFSQMGSDVTIVGHGEMLVDREDADIAQQVTDAYREEHDLRLGYTVTEMADDGGAKRHRRIRERRGDRRLGRRTPRRDRAATELGPLERLGRRHRNR